MTEACGICTYCKGAIGVGEPVVAWEEEGRFVMAHRFRQTCEGVMAADRKFLEDCGVALDNE